MQPSLVSLKFSCGFRLAAVQPTQFSAVMRLSLDAVFVQEVLCIKILPGCCALPTRTSAMGIGCAGWCLCRQPTSSVSLSLGFAFGGLPDGDLVLDFF